MMDIAEFRKKTEAHWEYTGTLLKLIGVDDMELCHFLYVEAMVHGFKHGIADRPVEIIKEIHRCPVCNRSDIHAPWCSAGHGAVKGGKDERILETAAQIAEALYDKTYWDDPSAGIAAEIRRLKGE